MGAIHVTIMANNPKLTQRHFRVLEVGLPGHHRKTHTKRYMDESGTKATNDNNDTDNSGSRIQNVYNCWDDVRVDFSILESIKQRQILPELETRPPGMDEFIRAVKVMRGEKAPAR